jgi:uncharacterized membrane protein
VPKSNRRTGCVANAANADGSVIVGDSGQAVIWRNGVAQSLATAVFLPVAMPR